MGFKQSTRRPIIKLLSTNKTVELQLQAQPILVVTEKKFSMAAGQWYIHLVPRPELLARVGSVKAQAYIYKNIKPMDMISIGFEKEHGAMMGFVDNVYRSKSVIGEKPTRIVIVRGRDFGKLMIEDKPRYAPLGATLSTNKESPLIVDVLRRIDKFIPPSTNQIKNGKKDSDFHPIGQYWISRLAPEHFGIDKDGKKKSLGQSWVDQPISEMILHFVEILGSFRTRVKFQGEEKALSDIIIPDLKSREGELTASNNANTLTGANVINQIKSVIDDEFYELWLDHKLDEEGAPKTFLRFRPKPWDFDSDIVTDRVNGGDETVGDSTDKEFTYEKSVTFVEGKEHHEIPDPLILIEAVGISDYQAYSIYMVNNGRELLGSKVYQKYGMNYPIFDFKALAKYGSKSLNVESKLIRETLGTDDNPEPDVSKERNKRDIIDAIRWRRDRIYNWYRYNPILESGRVTIRLNEDIRIGDKAHFPDMEFNHIGENGESYTGVDAYITGVKNSWIFGDSVGPQTHLSIIRGHNKEALEDYKNQNFTVDGVLRT